MSLAAPKADGDPHQHPFFQLGWNCWKVPTADRLAILIDAQKYYENILAALNHARESVVILAWDIDPRAPLALSRGAPAITLGDAMLRAVKRNPRLKINILCWDFSWLYVFERQIFPSFAKAFRHPRIRFVTDSRHPFAASHHQKVVIVDGELGFIGGLDLCLRRWDTDRHEPLDERRKDHAGRPYRPFHDVQAMFTGEAVTAMAELARERWRVATGEELEIPEPRGEAPWPRHVRADFRRVPLAISRTAWDGGHKPSVREIEALYLDCIRSARRHVYFECQYFTSRRIAEAILARLHASDPPEFLILLPQNNSGWKEQVTMGLIREGVMARIRASERADRVRFLYPVVRDESSEAGFVPISLHSKLMIVDDRILHLGSSNLSARSMGMDTECDVTILADGVPGAAERIARVRATLLAEHLGASPEHLIAATRKHGSLFEAIERTPRDLSLGRHLVPLEASADSLPDDSYLYELIDPEKPFGLYVQTAIPSLRLWP